MPATLRVRRAAAPAVEFHHGTYDVVVDGKRAGSIDDHETFETAQEPGRHTVRVRTGRYSSRTAAFTATDDETIAFRTHGGRTWPFLLASLAVPSLALKLVRE